MGCEWERDAGFSDQSWHQAAEPHTDTVGLNAWSTTQLIWRQINIFSEDITQGVHKAKMNMMSKAFVQHQFQGK